MLPQRGCQDAALTDQEGGQGGGAFWFSEPLAWNLSFRGSESLGRTRAWHWEGGLGTGAGEGNQGPSD